jgi:putative addiction module component (TIGR02574 family)
LQPVFLQLIVLFMSTQLSDILQMSLAERIQLVEDIWDSIAAVPEALPLTDAERLELDRRLAAYAQNSTEGISWDELKEKVRQSK